MKPRTTNRMRASMEKPIGVGVALFLTLVLVNYGVWSLTGYPAPYCGLRWLMLPLFATYWHLVLIILCITLFWALQRGIAATLAIVGLMLLVAAAPEWLEAIGNLGGACGRPPTPTG